MIKLFSIVILTASILIGGCKSETKVHEYRATDRIVINKNESVVVLGRRHKGEYETEQDFIKCVGEKLSVSDSGLNVIPEKIFIDSLYPYFEASTAPVDVKNLDKIIQNPLIAKKIDEFKLRYFIWIDGSTETINKTGEITCAIGPGGGGCFGYASWDDEANYEASIWDFEQIELSGKLSAETKGTSFMPAIIIPIPMLAQVQSNVCKALSNQILSFFSEQN